MPPDDQTRGSIFTAELVDGLAGTGCAKRWDPDRNVYVVNVSQVVRYVRQAVRARLAGAPGVDADKAADGVQHQTTEDPLVLRVMREADVPKVKLSVGLLPDAVADASPALQVMHYGFVHKKWRRAVLPVTRFKLQPRSYSLRARASGYRQEKIPLCDVYADQEESVWLVPSGDLGGLVTQPPVPPSQVRGTAAPGTLVVQSDDQLLPHEVAGESGEIVSVGVGNDAYRLPAGYYRVRPLAAGGAGTFGDRPADRFYAGSRISGPEWLVRVDSDGESPSASGGQGTSVAAAGGPAPRHRRASGGHGGLDELVRDADRSACLAAPGLPGRAARARPPARGRRLAGLARLARVARHCAGRGGRRPRRRGSGAHRAA